MRKEKMFEPTEYDKSTQKSLILKYIRKLKPVSKEDQAEFLGSGFYSELPTIGKTALFGFRFTANDFLKLLDPYKVYLLEELNRILIESRADYVVISFNIDDIITMARLSDIHKPPIGSFTLSAPSGDLIVLENYKVCLEGLYG